MTIAVNWKMPNRLIKLIQVSALAFTAFFLLRLGLTALPFFERFSQSNTQATWSNVGLIAGALLVPTTFAVLSRFRVATIVAISLATIAFSMFAAQALLALVDRLSDQTYILQNQFLTQSNPILPLFVSLIALTASIARLKTYSISLRQHHGQLATYEDMK
jgi:hypothetical protein